jgi:rhodanese-related sulfurtransferase
LPFLATKTSEIILKRFLILLFILIPSLLNAEQISTVCPNELSLWIKARKPLAIVDIQNAEEFKTHNYADSLSTGNEPARLKKIAARLRTSKGKVIVVSTTGGADAIKAGELLARNGVKRSRIMILEGGMETAAKNATCDCCNPASSQAFSK